MDVHIKKEIKTEVEEVNRSSAGFVCPQCQSHFLFSDFFEEHVREQHSNTNLGIDYDSDTTFSNLLASHKETFDQTAYRYNETCSRSLVAKSGSQSEKRSHSGGKENKCQTCSKTFTRKSDLKRHIRTVHIEKPHKCGACSRSFATNSELSNHEKRHYTKTFMCSTCLKSFATNYQLILHERTHTGEKPYECETCNRSFITKSRLTEHRTTHSLVINLINVKLVLGLFLVERILIGT